MKPAFKVSAWAFSLMELMIVVAVLALVAGIFLPQWVQRQRASGCRINCANNQRQIGLAFKTWALDNNDKYPMQVSVTNGGTMELANAGNVWPHFLAMSNELSTPRVLFCPDETDGWRTNAVCFTPVPPGSLPPGPLLTNDSQVSYFIGLDASEGQPQVWLAGDHNLKVAGKPAGHGLLNLWSNTPVSWDKPRPNHDGYGYVLLSDGSVSRLTNIRQSLVDTRVATNRLAVP